MAVSSAKYQYHFSALDFVYFLFFSSISFLNPFSGSIPPDPRKLIPPASVSSASALDRLLLCASSGVAMSYISGSPALAVSGLALFGSGCSISAVSPSSYTTILLSLLPLAVPFGSFRFSLSPSWVS